MKLERLDHFGIEVANLARAERFYTEVLGLQVVNRFGDQVLLECGGQNLALFEVPRPPLDDASRRPASRAPRQSTGAITIASTFSIPMATCSRW
jgi:catechol 2,3-dioxygenase-like lactoylglutathione lyase family enzyme